MPSFPGAIRWDISTLTLLFHIPMADNWSDCSCRAIPRELSAQFNCFLSLVPSLTTSSVLMLPKPVMPSSLRGVTSRYILCVHLSLLENNSCPLVLVPGASTVLMPRSYLVTILALSETWVNSVSRVTILSWCFTCPWRQDQVLWLSQVWLGIVLRAPYAVL